MTRIVIDPITRVGGQLRIEADVTAGRVDAAFASATMFRGIEAILRGRDPRDAWLLAQRICGTCTGVHALASVRAVETALAIQIPANARLLRNLLMGALLMRDHVMTFYQRSLPDWIDLSAAVTANPFEASRLAANRGAWRTSTPEAFAAIRDRLGAQIGSGRPGPFAPAWAGHPAYRLTPEESLLLAAHMLDALEWQRDFMRLHTLLAGKEAHPQTFLVGGMAFAPPWGGPNVSRIRQHPQVPDHNSPLALGDKGIGLMHSLVNSARLFMDRVVLPDAYLLARAYPDWLRIGAGPGNYLCNGEFPQDDAKKPARLFPNGRLVGGNLERSEPVDQASVGESVAHAWYRDEADAGPRAPRDGVTSPAWTGQVPLAGLSDGAAYSWVKAPRLDGLAMETGPLARVLVGAANGQAQVREALGRVLNDTGVPTDGIGGALGRMLARAVELDVVTSAMDGWLKSLEASLATGDVAVANIEAWDPASWPGEVDGWSLGEGPRGAVGHWLRIKDAVIDRYQVVDGSTWNASPRDAQGTPGPMEAALAGVAVADPAQPIELMRVIHSFAPCAACAAHVIEGAGGRGRNLANAPEGTR